MDHTNEPYGTKKGVLLPVVLDNKYARSDEDCNVEALDVSDFAIQESVRANRSGKYHAAPVPIETSRLADSVYFIIGDIFALLSANVLGALIGWVFGGSFSVGGWMFFIVPAWLLTAAGVGLYPGWGLNSVTELKKVGIVSLIVYATTLFTIGLTELTLTSGSFAFILGFTFSIGLIFSIRHRVAQNLTTTGRGGQTTVIYGASTSGRKALSSIRNDTRSGLIPIAFLDDDPGKWGQTVDGIPVLGDTNLVIPEASAAIVALPRSSKDSLESLLKGPLSYYQRIISIPEWDSVAATSVHSFDGGRYFGLNLAKSPIDPDHNGLKRGLDITVSVITAPLWMFAGLIIAAVIIIETRQNPVKSYVIKNARKQQFWVLRFTTPFRYHAFLRRTRLEHLPTLWNVLTGTLSLVGPTAWEFSPASLDDKTSISPATIRPGLTGFCLPSIAGSATPEGSDSAEQFYTQHWSIWLDLLILGRATSRLFMTWIGRA